MFNNPYHRLDEEDLNDLIGYMNALGFDGKPGPRNWLRAQIGDWAEAMGLPTECPDEGIPYGYEDYLQEAYWAMKADDYYNQQSIDGPSLDAFVASFSGEPPA